ncbi:unnamed protein product, partial [Iphiclides podalirius]
MTFSDDRNKTKVVEIARGKARCRMAGGDEAAGEYIKTHVCIARSVRGGEHKREDDECCARHELVRSRNACAHRLVSPTTGFRPILVLLYPFPQLTCPLRQVRHEVGCGMSEEVVVM